MFGSAISFLALLSPIAAQRINFPAGTGTRSLWIPYKTISGVPEASILGHDSKNRTTYVLHCPTAQTDCAIAPKLTLTEGTDLVRWTSSTSSGATTGTVVINCPLTNTPVTCQQNAHNSDEVKQTSVTVAASDILYQAVDVTAGGQDQKNKKTTTSKDKTTIKEKTTVTQTPTSEGGAAEITGWVGAVGAVGAGIAALAAL